MEQAVNYARRQADGLDNIAPTTLQGQVAWQYAQSDNFLSPEEAAAVMRRDLEPYRAQLEAKLSVIGWQPEHLSKYPAIEADLSAGRQTNPVEIYLKPDLTMHGRLRIVMTEQGPDLRITPIQVGLSVPQEIGGVRLSPAEQRQLREEGALPRPLMIPENGQLIPTYLRVDAQTNTLEFWRIRAEQLPTKIMGIDLNKDQQLQLASGHPVRLSGLLDQQGEPFNATINISASKQQLQFSDLNRTGVAVKPDAQHVQQVAHNDEGAKTDLTRSKEVATGAPAMSNSQLETVAQLLKGSQQISTGGKKMKIH